MHGVGKNLELSPHDKTTEDDKLAVLVMVLVKLTWTADTTRTVRTREAELSR